MFEAGAFDDANDLGLHTEGRRVREGGAGHFGIEVDVDEAALGDPLRP